MSMKKEAKYPSQLAERFQIRLPDGLRDRIRDEASQNNRSMNAEIVAALEEKYPAPAALSPEYLLREWSPRIREMRSPEERLACIKELNAEIVKTYPRAQFELSPPGAGDKLVLFFLPYSEDDYGYVTTVKKRQLGKIKL